MVLRLLRFGLLLPLLCALAISSHAHAVEPTLSCEENREGQQSGEPFLIVLAFAQAPEDTGEGTLIVYVQGCDFSPGEDVSLVLTLDAEQAQDVNLTLQVVADEEGVFADEFTRPYEQVPDPSIVIVTATGDQGSNAKYVEEPLPPEDDGDGSGDDGEDTSGGGDDQQSGDTQQGGDDQQSGTVTKTFKLTLYGSVPEVHSFYVVYTAEGEDTELRNFCGEGSTCQGNGTVYTQSVEFPVGTKLQFKFVRTSPMTDREDAPEPLEDFYIGTETLSDDITNAAWYTFSGDQDKHTGGNREEGDETGHGSSGEDGSVDHPLPEQVPSTGGGGLAGTGLPMSSLAASSMLLIAAGWTILRRW